MAAWADNVAAELPAAASHQGCRQHFSAHRCEHPLPADFGGGGKQLCASLLAATAPLTALLQRMLMPVLPLSYGVRQIRFLFSFSPPTHKSCRLQPNCIFFRQIVSGAMQMSFEMWRSGLYLSVNCLSGTDI